MAYKAGKAKTRTFGIKNHQNKTCSSRNGCRSNRGFSILEILVALSIVAGISYIVFNGINFGSNNVDEAVDLIERSVRFANNETVLQSAICRIKISIDEDPAKIMVEYGTGKEFILPEFSEFDKADLSLEERERREEVLKKINTQFQPVAEFSEEAKEFDDSVRVIGMASSVSPNVMHVTGEGFIYFYPSGEKDNAIILLANEDEMVRLEIFPFTQDIKKDYYLLDGTGEWEDQVNQKAEEIYQAWLKEMPNA